jgi:hypothetical protein
MDTGKLEKILRETTVSLRKGAERTEEDKGNVRVTHLYLMPHADEVKDVEKVDLHFIVVGVKTAEALNHHDEFVSLVATYPDFERFKQGLSYIELGGVIGDQEAAFQFMALGKVLGLWSLITPEVLGITGSAADMLAGQGLVMISGYKP